MKTTTQFKEHISIRHLFLSVFLCLVVAASDSENEPNGSPNTSNGCAAGGNQQLSYCYITWTNNQTFAGLKTQNGPNYSYTFVANCYLPPATSYCNCSLTFTSQTNTKALQCTCTNATATQALTCSNCNVQGNYWQSAGVKLNNPNTPWSCPCQNSYLQAVWLQPNTTCSPIGSPVWPLSCPTGQTVCNGQCANTIFGP